MGPVVEQKFTVNAWNYTFTDTKSKNRIIPVVNLYPNLSMFSDLLLKNIEI